ncbi:serine hydrolase domain-containing protein [Rubinisphaera sp.]|uniref:serine hydrolase domain-containing protein n=1 Tax=Rubinisphaera sp. TaxID=2024857 RepID=UPI000C11A0BB|nr:serine hydrolase domain-containing protein [Rubinisphaera sp.]MBV12004.1 serine hydrolase [Rubinisphaera sp.]
MFKHFHQVVEEGIAKNLHYGIQLSVSVEDQNFEEAFGTIDQNTPLQADDTLCWLSAAKPITAVGILILQEQNSLSIDETLGEILPQFQESHHASIPLRQLLTHTSSLREVPVNWPQASWPEILVTIANSEPVENWSEDQSAAYLPSSSWFLLGSVIEQRSGQSYVDFIQQEILDPVGMNQTRCIADSTHASSAHEVLLYDRVKGQLVLSPLLGRMKALSPSPGSSFRGPAADLRLFFDMLRSQGKGEFGQVISQASIEQMVQRHRQGRVDQTLQHIVDYGLGVIIDSNEYGPQTVPYGFGTECSSKTFGHGGSQCAIAFADPVRERSVVIIANGRPGEGQHQKRFRQLLEALELDLKSLS